MQLISMPFLWPEISVTGKFKQQLNFLSAYCHIHVTLIPKEVTQDSFQRADTLEHCSL